MLSEKFRPSFTGPSCSLYLFRPIVIHLCRWCWVSPPPKDLPFNPTKVLCPPAGHPKHPALCISPFILEFFVFHLWGVDKNDGGTRSRQAPLLHVPVVLLTIPSQNALHLSNLSWLIRCLSSLTRAGTSWGRNLLAFCTAVSLAYRTVLGTLKGYKVIEFRLTRFSPHLDNNDAQRSKGNI